MIITIDSREKYPWAFPDWVITKVGTLKTGDYALAGDEQSLSLERKELNDFLNSISINWERFQRELLRMQLFISKVIIVEGNFSECCFLEQNGEIIPPKHNHLCLSPQFVMKRLAELTLKNISVIFAGNALLASAIAFTILKERENEIKYQNRKDFIPARKQSF